MSGSKHFDRIAVIATALTLVITILFMNGSALGIEVAEHTMGYENRLFDNTRVHTIDIVINKNEWDDMIENAANEEYHTANVVIDGESYKNVGIRTKGNTSLSTVATLDSERYSFKIEFDRYDKTGSYYGLDKLSLNNLIQDSTMMKDYLTYTMMNEFDVNSSLCSYVYITVNGEDWGLYLAVEGVEEAFLERNYGSDFGNLYKPDSLSFGGGRGNGGDFDPGDFDFNFGGANSQPGGFFENSDPSSVSDGEMPNMPLFDDNTNMPNGFDFSDIPENFDPSTMFENENGDFSFGGMGSDDVKLQYIDDEIGSYSNIWNNAKTDITESDQNRLIQSLKKLSNNEDIESVVDTEQVIRYFVVHNYVCNGDSYTGSMVHNYYLREKDGRLSMIPWDYNLAFGTFQSGNATETVNTPIDTPVSGGSGEDRPMWNWIVENEEYTQMYHRYFAEFLSDVDIDGIIDNAYEIIKDYVAKDPTAFYDYDEFESGVETLRQFCALRSESISAQLENGETENDMSYADASGITLSDMGSMGGMGGGMPDMPNMPDNMGDFAPTSSDDTQNPPNAHENGENNVQSDVQTDGTDEPDSKKPQSDFDPSDMRGSGSFPTPDNKAGAENESSRPSGGNMQMPEGDFPFDMNGETSQNSDMAAWLGIVVSVVVLAIGIFVAKRYKH